MIIKSLTLKNFRNHSFLTYDFYNNINLFIGDNGVGKTNVCEAIYLLSLARSFKNASEKELIKQGNDLALIETKIALGSINHTIQIYLQENAKKVLVDKKVITKLSELSKLVNVVLFEPKDVLLFKGSPKDRRNFLNISIAKQNEYYLELISNYEKLLKQRNNLLKQDNIDYDLLETLDEMLIKTSKDIIYHRQEYIKDINNVLNKIVSAISYKEDNIKNPKIEYCPFVKFDSQFIKSAKEAFKNALENDLKRKATTIGIHREDFIVTINGKNIADYGSQGENRLLAIALKLAPYFLISDPDKKPIVILDDVTSELDELHKDKLLKFISKFQQVFITATKLEIKDAHTFVLKKKGE